jgi:uncharacterized protein YfdQ (DUF2303 family)
MDSDAVEAIVAAINKNPEIVTPPGMRSLAFVPQGYSLHALKEHLTEPERVCQHVTLLTSDDFLACWKRFKSDSSVVFGDERNATYRAIVDFHAADGTPKWCSHMATYACPKSKEWEVWNGSNGKRMTQAAFAEFIEDNYPDIIKPSHAEMIQVSTNLQAKKSVAFSQATRLDNGQSQLVYQEEVKGTVESSKGGTMKVPDGFTLKLAVFLGGTAYQLDARLRYRIDDGKLQIWYDLHRPHKVVEAATQAVTQAIRKGIGEDPMFLGAAA